MRSRERGVGVGILLDQARRHAIGRAARRREVDGESARQRLHARLGRGRRREARQAARKGMGHERRHADQAAPAPAFTSHGLAVAANSKKAEVMAARLPSQPARSSSPIGRRSAKPALLTTTSSRPNSAPSRRPGVARCRLGRDRLRDQRLGAGAAHEPGDLLRRPPGSCAHAGRWRYRARRVPAPSRHRCPRKRR